MRIIFNTLFLGIILGSSQGAAHDHLSPEDYIPVDAGNKIGVEYVRMIGHEHCWPFAERIATWEELGKDGNCQSLKDISPSTFEHSEGDVSSCILPIKHWLINFDPSLPRSEQTQLA